MEFQINHDMLWNGLTAVYLPSMLPIFDRLQSVMDISDESEKAAYHKKTMKYLTLWMTGLVLLLVLRHIF